MYRLSDASRAALDDFAQGLTHSQARTLRAAVDRVCADPAGRRAPTHRYTRPFRAAKRYVPGLKAGEKVWEFKTNHCRGLFVTSESPRALVFVAVRGKRFFKPAECPWPH